MALSLQQQLSNYHSMEKEVAGIEALVNKKNCEKLVAGSTLLDHFSQIQAELDEE